MPKPTDFSIPTLDADTLMRPVGDWMEEHGADEVADFLRQVATRGASFDFGAPVRIKDSEWRETPFRGRVRLIFGPDEAPWIILTPRAPGHWSIYVNYLGFEAQDVVEGIVSDATERALQLCRERLHLYFEPLVDRRKDGGAELPG